MKKSPKITIKDIARLAGVSKSTVSRVINKEKGVSEAAQQQVNAIVDAYQFTPSVSARGLKGHNKSVIAVIVTRLDSYSENAALKSILALCEKQNIDVLVLESQFNNKIFNQHLSMLFSRQIDGIIAFSFSNLKIAQPDNWQEKMVFISQKVAHFISITYDNEGAVKKLYQCYANQFEHIAYIGIDDNDYSTGKARNQHYLFLSQQNNKPSYIYHADFSLISGYEQAKLLFEQHKQIEAIICATDNIALGVCKFCQEVGSKVKIGYIGHNAMLDFLFPHLDRVDLHFDLSGKVAIEQLLQLINRPTSSPNQDIVFIQPSTLQHSEL